jgi:hypothetical protein
LIPGWSQGLHTREEIREGGPEAVEHIVRGPGSADPLVIYDNDVRHAGEVCSLYHPERVVGGDGPTFRPLLARADGDHHLGGGPDAEVREEAGPRLGDSVVIGARVLAAGLSPDATEHSGSTAAEWGREGAEGG